MCASVLHFVFLIWHDTAIRLFIRQIIIVYILKAIERLKANKKNDASYFSLSASWDISNEFYGFECFYTMV